MNDESQWGNTRGQNHGNGYMGRKPGVHKYGDNKTKNYSPSASYNYQNGQGRPPQGQPYPQQPRRRVDRFKRESINYTDKLIRQNEIIIGLLRDIRGLLGGTARQESDGGAMQENEQLQAGNDVTVERSTGNDGNDPATSETALSFEQNAQTDDADPRNRAFDEVDG